MSPGREVSERQLLITLLNTILHSVLVEAIDKKVSIVRN